MKKPLTLIVLIVLALIFYFLKNNPSKNTSGPSFNATDVQLIFTKHAKCRMDCRHITEQEIREIIGEGKINERKSGWDEQHRDSTYAYEGYSHDNQNIRVVVAPKGNDLVVITVIDLKVDWACACS